jgi:hypothetical protein
MPSASSMRAAEAHWLTQRARIVRPSPREHRETRAAHNVGGKEWCELAACNRLMEVARVAPGDARIAPKVEPDDAVSLASHVDPPLVTSHARGKRAAEGEPEPDSAPAAKQQVVVWRIFECGHRWAMATPLRAERPRVSTPASA